MKPRYILLVASLFLLSCERRVGTVRWLDGRKYTLTHIEKNYQNTGYNKYTYERADGSKLVLIEK